MVGAGLLILGLAVVYVLVPTEGRPSKLGDTVGPLMSLVCTAAIFNGVMLLLAAILF
jgi:hypothetical protein